MTEIERCINCCKKECVDCIGVEQLGVRRKKRCAYNAGYQAGYKASSGDAKAKNNIACRKYYEKNRVRIAIQKREYYQANKARKRIEAG